MSWLLVPEQLFLYLGQRHGLNRHHFAPVVRTADLRQVGYKIKHCWRGSSVLMMDDELSSSKVGQSVGPEVEARSHSAADHGLD